MHGWLDILPERPRRFATPEEAVQFLAAVPEEDRAVWAVAMYAGLRRGEIMELRWQDVGSTAGTILVARSWDLEHGPGDTETWKAAGLKRLTLHACRHSYASFAIAAGVNAKALSAPRTCDGPVLGSASRTPREQPD